jgi:hypothetical protein
MPPNNPLKTLLDAIKETGSFACTAIIIGILAECLRENGALRPGQFEEKISEFIHCAEVRAILDKMER